MCIFFVLITFAMLHTHIFLITRLRTLGAIPPHHPTPYWGGDLLSAGTKLNSPFLNLV